MRGDGYSCANGRAKSTIRLEWYCGGVGVSAQREQHVRVAMWSGFVINHDWKECVLQAINWLPRTEGTIRLGFARVDGGTALRDLHQAGAARVRFPRSHDAAPEAVLLNTAGGLTGGDRIAVDVNMEADCDATITSAAAEKVYRSLGDPTLIEMGLRLDAGARCLWLPQPTILFNASNLRRIRRRHGRLCRLSPSRCSSSSDARARRCAWAPARRLARAGAAVVFGIRPRLGAVAQTLASAVTLDCARAMPCCSTGDDSASPSTRFSSCSIMHQRV